MSDRLPLADLRGYENLPAEELNERISIARKKMGAELLILGHHYQSNAVIQHADLRGDSFQLAKLAADNTECRAIVFCGVHFMAETADILANRREAVERRGGDRVTVVLPDHGAGCPMADMASLDQVEICWEQLGAAVDTTDITPVTYVNSSAELKAFCGRHGGIVCTSSNAARILSWAFASRKRVLFFPDQHLGRNTALTMGIHDDEMPLWDPFAPEMGGVSADVLQKSRVILWKGFCNVHMRFLPEHVDQIRKLHPGVRVIVHPESMREVVDKSDDFGSTGAIIKAIESAPAGTKWAIGTEANLVQRLAEQHPEQEIYHLGSAPSTCGTMKMITLANTARALDCLAAGEPFNVINVPKPIADAAEKALMRMLEYS